MDKQPHWLNKSDMAASLGISVQAFDKWGVRPAARIGREALFDVRSVLDNRLAQAARKYQPTGDGVEGIDPHADKKLLQETLRLTAERADAQQLSNEVKRRRLVPVDFAVFALARVAAQLGSLLDTITPGLQRRHPDIDPRLVESLQRDLATARNTAAQLGDKLPEMLEEYVDALDE